MRAFAAAASVFIVLVVGTVPAPADQIADKRSEAARLATALEAQSRRVSILTEDLNAARLRAEELEGAVSAATAEWERTTQQARLAQRRLKSQAVAAYVRGGQVATIALLTTRIEADGAVRQTYVRSVAAKEQAALGVLHEARERLDERRAELEKARSAARDALGRVEESRKAAAAAADTQRATLARVQGELASLVEAERRRRAEAEARRARAALEARRAREAAARSAVAGRTPSAVAAAGPARPPAAGAEAAVAEARRQLGKPYEYGAAGPGSFDCSGLTMWAWRAAGRSLPHSSRAQYSATARVPLSDLQVGDLLFFGSPIHHVGIYAGNGQMIEASETGTPVRYASIYRRDLVGIGRVG